MMVELNSSDIKDQFQINKSLLRENTELKEKESKVCNLFKCKSNLTCNLCT